MKISAVGVSTTNMMKSAEFYTLLGFMFPTFKEDEQHLEPITPEGSARLMIDHHDLAKSIIGEEPTHGNHSSFGIEYESADQVNSVAEKLTQAGFNVVKAPWDAFWGQRYCIVADPDGYMCDLYAAL